MAYRLIPLLCAVLLVLMSERAFAFAVAPAILDVSGARGTTVERTFALINNGNTEETYYLGTLGFVADDSSGAPRFFPEAAEPTGLTQWISFPVSPVTVPANTKVDMPFTVVIPNDVESGTYQAAITVSTTPSELVAANGATVDAKLAVLVFLTVEGETNANYALVDFASTDAGGLVAHLGLPYAYRIQNQGNVFVIPRAEIVVTDIFGRTVLRTDANADSARVLPGQTRTLTGTIATPPATFWKTVRHQAMNFAVGPVTATLVVGETDFADAPALHFWLFPWQLIGCVLVLVLLLVVLRKTVVRSRRNLSSISTES